MRIVVKSGSAMLSRAEGGLDTTAVHRLASQLAWAHSAGHEVVLVTSGAIAAGTARLGWSERPSDLRLKQAAAAVGQLALMRAYEEAFSKDGITPAQMLLTRDDLRHRERYLNVRNTLLHLLTLRTLPIINENDCVSTEEIQFGDNDTLAAAVATKIEAQKLILLSDVPGLFEQDENGALTTRVIDVVERVTPEMERRALRGTGSKMSVGGIVTKLSAARMATAAGVETWLASGYQPDTLQRVLEGAAGAGTRFLPRAGKINARAVWIAFGRTPRGSIVIDDGARHALLDEHKSLLPSGIKRVNGVFDVGDTVGIRSEKGGELARGLVNFSSTDVRKIQGRHSRDIAALLNRTAAAEVVHRDNLVIL